MRLPAPKDGGPARARRALGKKLQVWALPTGSLALPSMPPSRVQSQGPMGLPSDQVNKGQMKETKVPVPTVGGTISLEEKPDPNKAMITPDQQRVSQGKESATFKLSGFGVRATDAVLKFVPSGGKVGDEFLYKVAFFKNPELLFKGNIEPCIASGAEILRYRNQWNTPATGTFFGVNDCGGSTSVIIRNGDSEDDKITSTDREAIINWSVTPGESVFVRFGDGSGDGRGFYHSIEIDGFEPLPYVEVPGGTPDNPRLVNFLQATRILVAGQPTNGTNEPAEPRTNSREEAKQSATPMEVPPGQTAAVSFMLEAGSELQIVCPGGGTCTYTVAPQESTMREGVIDTGLSGTMFSNNGDNPHSVTVQITNSSRPASTRFIVFGPEDKRESIYDQTIEQETAAVHAIVLPAGETGCGVSRTPRIGKCRGVLLYVHRAGTVGRRRLELKPMGCYCA